MHYNLKKPCANCPFRSDRKSPLRAERRESIADYLRRGGNFACHKTIDYDDEDAWDEEPGWFMPGPGVEQCAGAMIVLEKEREEQGHAGVMMQQMARIEARFGAFKPEQLDMSSPTFENLDDFASSEDV